MLEFTRLKDIIINLHSVELKAIRKNLKLNGKELDAEQSEKKLLEIVLSDSNIDIQIVYSKLYGRINSVALRKLMQRLIEKILDQLINPDLLTNISLYDDMARRGFVIKKKLLYYDILNTHKVTVYAADLLDNIIILCKKIENYDFLLIALEKKLIKVSLGWGVKLYNNIFKEIIHYNDCSISLKRSSYLLRLYTADYDYIKREFSFSRLNEHINITEADFKRTGSKRLKINLFYLKGIYYDNSSNYQKSKLNFIGLYNYLRANEDIINDLNLTGCLLNIAECETLLGHYDSSIEYIKKISNKYFKNEFNSKLIDEAFFYNYFYSGDEEMTLFYLNNLLKGNNKNTSNNFLGAKRLFFKAVVLTTGKRYAESNKLLSDSKLLDKDKDGWNIGYRLLSIINNIELGKFIFVESQIENLRKHMARVDKESVIFPRNLLILKILISLVKNSFDFILTEHECNDYLDLLQGKGKNQSWKIKGPELIPFHLWFQSKVKGVSYDHVEAMKKLKKMNKRS